jgi:EAL domain-containing protein (putative c-di-GMP-specific phosphodiesterase class I)
LLKMDGAARSVMVVVQLNRSDRLRALAQESISRTVMLEAMKRVQAVLRPNDRWAIASHEELWLVLSDLPSVGLAELATRTLQQSLSRPVRFQDAQGRDTVVHLRPLVGAAWMAHTTHADPMVLLSAASQAALQAARHEEHVVVTRLDSDEVTVDHNELERDLRIALHGNELEVHFQPQIELVSRRCVAVEALVRWNCPKRGYVNPQTIATICEERGMMVLLTQFVLNTGLRHLASWHAQDIDVDLAVNISASALSDATFPSAVRHALETWEVPPQMLTLELTESSIVENEKVALAFMNQLAAQGCKLAIDDFGTGYSSFAYLRQFPLHELKIDQMFVRNILQEQGDQRIVQALTDLAHTFEMRALAEGVESGEAANLLQGFGCDVAQGWHFSKAISSAAFVTWFTERAKVTTADAVR